MLLSLVSCGGTKGEPTKEEEVKTEEPAPEKEEPAEPAPWDVDGDGTFSVLALGNSFMQDTVQYLYALASDLGIEDIYIADLYHGGIGVDFHANSIKNDTEDYMQFTSTDPNGAWDVDPTVTLASAVKSRSWDYILINSTMTFGVVPEAKEQEDADLAYYCEFIKEHAPDSVLVWNMSWPLPKGSSYDAFFNYFKEDQLYMYDCLTSIMQERIIPYDLIDNVLPIGTAIQNVRTANVNEDLLHRDAYHLSNGYGRYIASLTAVKFLTSLDISGLTYAPDGVTEEQIAIAVESVNNAYESPFEVTQSAYHVEN